VNIADVFNLIDPSATAELEHWSIQVLSVCNESDGFQKNKNTLQPPGEYWVEIA